MSFHSPVTIDRLPVELLAEVFKFGANLNWPYDDSPFLLKSNSSGADFIYDPDFQIAVSHVSRSWRSVALSLPSLWTTLHFSKPAHIARAQTFLERCRPSTPPRVFDDDDNPKFDRYCLDILILTVARPQEDHLVQILKAGGQSLIDEHLVEIFKLLTPLTLLWRTFHLRVRDGKCKAEARKALGLMCGEASRLETLQLYHFEDFAGADELHEATYRNPVICFANHAPQLKHVSLIGVNLPWHLSPYLTDLQSLELALHLDRVRPPYDIWSKILQESPDLRRLRLHYSGPQQADWIGEAKIRLDRLEQLSLIDLDSDYLSRLLPRLEMPNVRRLELDLDSEEQDYTSTLQAWTNNQGLGLGHISSVTSLKVTALECDLVAFWDFLRNLTSLRELELDFDKVCTGEDNSRMDVWKLFAGKEHETIVGDCQASDSAPSTHLLSRLEIFKMFRLPGTQVREIIRHREGLGREENNQNDDVSPTATTRYSPAAPPVIPGTLLVNVRPEIRQRSKYIVKYTEQMKGKDEVLDELVTRGCCWFPEDVDRELDVAVDPGAEVKSTSEATLLRKLGPEVEAAYAKRRADGSPNPAKWRVVVVDTELVADEGNEEDDDESVANSDDDDNDGDGFGDEEDEDEG